jgi:hypothetical protein
MMRELSAQEPSVPSAPATPSPAPVFGILAAVTLAFMALAQLFRSRSQRPGILPSPDEAPQDDSPGLPREEVDRLDATQAVAIFLIGADHLLEPTSVRMFRNLYSKEYAQILFVSVGVVDYAVIDGGAEGLGRFKGSVEAKRLKKKTRLALDPYLESAHQLGLKADCRVSVATDAVDEIDALSDEIAAVYSRAVFFVSKLVFQKPRWFHRILHRGTSDAIRKRLEKKGLPITVLPVVVPL